MPDIDVTELVDFGGVDDELLPLTKCVCGAEFESWDFVISIYPESPRTCRTCGRELYFSNAIHIYQKVNDDPIQER